MKENLTKESVKALKPQDKPFEVIDETLPGFVLRVQPSGAMSYYAVYRRKDGRRTRIVVGDARVLSPQEARKDAREKLADAVRGHDPQVQKQAAREDTLEGFLKDTYLPWVKANRKTGEVMVRDLRSAFRTMLKKKLSDITGWQVEKWRSERLKHASVATVNRNIAYLRAVMSKALEWGHLDGPHPLRKVKLPREDRGRVRYLTADEEKTLFGAIDERDGRMRVERIRYNSWCLKRNYPLKPDLLQCAFTDHLRPLIVLALNTGLRRGELFRLEWRDIDFPQRTITVRGEIAKSGKTRHVPLNAIAYNTLRAWREQNTGNGIVFEGDDGKPLVTIKKGWATVSAGIKDFRFHDLRHTFASRLAMAGIDLNTIRELLGHADFALTQRYSLLSPAHKAAAVEVLVMPDNVLVMPDNVVAFPAKTAQE